MSCMVYIYHNVACMVCRMLVLFILLSVVIYGVGCCCVDIDAGCVI